MPRFQFSLRSLFIFVTLLAILLGLIVAPAERQRRAVRAIEKVGGYVEYEADGQRKALIHAPEWLQTIVGQDYFKAIIGVRLRNTKIGDAGLEHLKGLTSLKLLYLHGTKVSDTGLEHLKGLTSLEDLELSGTEIGDAGLEHLKGLTSLQQLRLSNTQISDAGLKHLKGLTSLTFLQLGNTEISDTGLEHLKGLTSLKVLDLGGTKISDTGLAKLKAELPLCAVFR